MLDSGEGPGRPGQFQIRETFAVFKELKNTPYGTEPLLALIAIYGMQQIEGSAYSYAGPTFVRERGIEIPQIISVVALVGFVALFLNIILGYFARAA